MVVKTIESYEEFQTLINGDKPVVIDFWATWCGPCKVIGPIFEKISDTPAGEKLGFYKVDVDAQDKIAAEVGIKAMPTFVFFKGGQVVKQVVGANPQALQVSSQRLHSTIFGRSWAWRRFKWRRGLPCYGALKAKRALATTFVF